MTNNVSTLNVKLYGKVIGTITNVGHDKTLFAFTEDYIADTERPILSLGFKDSLGELVTEHKQTQTKLLPLFSNLLPEGAMRQYLADRVGVNPEREFFLLWVLGQDLSGAITVEDADGEPLPPAIKEAVEAKPNDEQALHFSLAGVQLKFSAVQNAQGGLTIPVNGAGGHWIVKLPDSKFDQVPENEFSMMELARKVGIDVPVTKLIAIDEIDNLPKGIESFGEKAFVIERFDRKEDGQSVHIEDFAQIFGVYPHDKYKKASIRNIAEVIGIEGQESDIEELIRRLVFNTLIGNADMHLKNWSLIYKDKFNASIAPAYDFVSTIPYMSDDAAALNVSRSKKFADFNLDELSHMAAKARLPEKLVLDTARDTVQRFHDVWRVEKNHLYLNDKIISAIDAHIKILPIADEG